MSGFTTKKFWRTFEYNGVEMLFSYNYEGDEMHLTSQMEIEGIGIVTSLVECTTNGEISGAEAAAKWLSDLTGDDAKKFYDEAYSIFVVTFYGGD